MLTALVVAAVILFLLFFMPKYTTGKILFTESFVPDLQVFNPEQKRDLSDVPVRIEIVHRKLYRVKILDLLKPLFNLLPSSYSVRPGKDGVFTLWAYPFDIINVLIGEDKYRVTYTLRHRVNNYLPKYLNHLLIISSFFSPKLIHEECIEIHTTLGKTCGYTDKISATPGEELNVMISTRAETCSIEIIRVGASLEKVETISDVPGTFQNIETKFPSAFGCAWKPTLKYKIPDELKSGCYIMRLTGNVADDRAFIPFIIKPSTEASQIAVIASTNTWHAYNSWGGQNFYINYTSFPSKYILSTQRPLDIYIRNPIEDSCQITRDHLLVGERFVWSWLEREGIKYDLYSDVDLHSEETFINRLKKYKVIILSTHNEYWSLNMINHLKDYINEGGNVVSLSGNTLYKEVSYPDQNLMVLDGAYLRYKGFREETVLGVAQDLRGFATWAPYKVTNSDHWVFDNTNVRNGDVIGKEGLNVSPDGVSGASGWETDKIYPDSPSNTVQLAKGMNAGEGGADMSICENSGGGNVFSVGSITYGGSLLLDNTISQITKNVINRFLAV